MESNLPFDKLIRKFSDHRSIDSLEDFQERLDQFFLQIKKEYEDSKEAEHSYQEEYEEKLSKLDYSGSKKAIEESRHQLARSLELDVQLEFLMTIKKISSKIPEQSLQTTKGWGKFSQIASQIFDRKKLQSKYGRQLLLNQFKKFLPSSVVDSILDEKGHDEDIELILQEVKNGTPADSTMDNEIKKIIEEVRSKKGSTK